MSQSTKLNSSPLIVSILAVLLASCGGSSGGDSDSDSNSGTTNTSTGTGTNTGTNTGTGNNTGTGDKPPVAGDIVDKRMKAMNIDMDNNGATDVAVNFDYDAFGRIISRTFTVHNDGFDDPNFDLSTINQYTESFTYDGDSPMMATKEKVQEIGSGLGNFTTSNTYSYDNQGKLIEDNEVTTSEVTFPVSLSISITAKRTFNYTGDLITSIDGEMTFNNPLTGQDETLAAPMTYTYNGKNQITEITWSNPKTTILPATEATVTFTYNDDDTIDQWESIIKTPEINDQSRTHVEMTYLNGKMHTQKVTYSSTNSPAETVKLRTLYFEENGLEYREEVDNESDGVIDFTRTYVAEEAQCMIVSSYELIPIFNLSGSNFYNLGISNFACVRD